MTPGTRTDIRERQHIEELVGAFYGQVRGDELLGPIFNGIIGDRWPEHMERMNRFWATLLIEEASYAGTPLRPHMAMPIGEEHFQRWVSLFHATVDGLFEGPVALLAKRNAARMADMFHERIALRRMHPERFIQ